MSKRIRIKKSTPRASEFRVGQIVMHRVKPGVFQVVEVSDSGLIKLCRVVGNPATTESSWIEKEAAVYVASPLELSMRMRRLRDIVEGMEACVRIVKMQDEESLRKIGVVGIETKTTSALARHTRDSESHIAQAFAYLSSAAAVSPVARVRMDTTNELYDWLRVLREIDNERGVDRDSPGTENTDG